MLRLLVVEDEPALRRLISASLVGSGWEVTAVSDGSTALDSARRIQPDLILLDVGLPGMNGIEVLQHLRADARTAGVPVVYLTGLVPDSGPAPDGLLAKPFTPTSLRNALAPFVS